MPKIAEVPKALKGMAFHGVDLLDLDREQVPATCPFCSKRKFFASRETGQWDCKVCGRTGNPQSFLVQLWEESWLDLPDEFVKDRSVLDFNSLMDIGVKRSMADDEIIVPSYGADGKLDNLHRYAKNYKTGKRTLYPTPDTQVGMFGASLVNAKRKTLYVVEGPWKVAVLREVLARAKRSADGSLSVTGNVEASLLADADVIGVPGCNTWHEHWNAIVKNKNVVILFDSDHPREVGGKIVPPSGWNAARLLSGKLAGATEPPESIRVLRWGPDGYDSNSLSGHDLRDAMSGKGARDRVQELGKILSMVEPIPEDWVAGRSPEEAARGGVHLDTIPCDSWKDLVKQWRKAMRWSDGLDRTLSVMLASVLSTDMMDAQLWIQVVSPPSTGKTQLCDAIGAARRRVRSVGNFTGLHSGFQTDANAEEDHSLLSQIKNMSLVVKDGDTLLKSPNREKILSQIRDAYDTNCAVAYGNRVKREYVNHRFSFIMAGTEAMLEMDAADLGARFLYCIIMTGIDGDLEREVNRRGFHRIFNNRGTGANGSANTHADAEVIRAKAMTGGYVEWLRDNAADIRAAVEVTDVEATQEAISHLAQLVAHVRARPSKTQDEAVTREMSARLNEQLTKLAICLAGVMNKGTVDREVMRRVRQVAMDTARGKTLNVVRAIAATRGGIEASQLATAAHVNQTEVRRYLRFLAQIGVTEVVQRTEVTRVGPVQRLRWRLTEAFSDVYRDATGERPLCRLKPVEV